MFVLSKKRLGIISSILLVCVFVFVFQIANTDKTVPTVSLPVSNKVIVLDAGHGNLMRVLNRVMAPLKLKQI